MSDSVTLDDIQLELLKIENQMHRVDGWNLRDRWKSGRLLVGQRSPETRYLPKGWLTTVAATLKVSTRELSDRMRVADTYRTDAAFTQAAHGRTWTELLRSLPPTREARTGSTRKPPLQKTQVDPTTPEEWQMAVNLAHFFLCIDSARQDGLIEGGDVFDILRCEDVLARGKAMGIVPHKWGD